MAKYGLTKKHHHPDNAVDGFMTETADFAAKMEGDLIGPFDHPDGISANAPFQVAHSLGKKPGIMVVEDPGTTGGAIYATREDREKWTKETITIRSTDTANRLICVRVRERIGA